MLELGQLDKAHEMFAERKVRIVAVSNDSEATSKQTQAQFPHLVIVADPHQVVAKAVEVIHAGAAPDGSDTNAPTTFLIDNEGYVRYFYRPESFFIRKTPDQLGAAIDETWK